MDAHERVKAEGWDAGILCKECGHLRGVKFPPGIARLQIIKPGDHCPRCRRGFDNLVLIFPDEPAA